MVFPLVQTGGGSVDLSACEKLVNKDAANGYAGLTAGSLLKAAEFPTPTTSTFGGVKDVAAVSNKFATSIVNGVAVLAQPTLSNLSDTPAANLVVASPNGSTGALTARALVQADLPSPFTAAGIGFLWAYIGQSFPPATATTVGFFALNQPLYYLTQVLQPITIRKAVLTITTLQAASKVYVAIYDSAFNKVTNSDFPNFNGASATTQSVTLATPVVLNPGIYYIGVAEDTAGVVLAGFAGGNNGNLGVIFNTNVNRCLTGANNLSAGVMPSSIGAQTLRNSAGLMAVLLES